MLSSQLPIPWALRALVERPLSHTEELLEVLGRDGEPLVAQWARGMRGKVKDTDELVAELDRVEAGGVPVARSLGSAVRSAWREFGGVDLPHPSSLVGQWPLPSLH